MPTLHNFSAWSLVGQISIYNFYWRVSIMFNDIFHNWFWSKHCQGFLLYSLISPENKFFSGRLNISNNNFYLTSIIYRIEWRIQGYVGLLVIAGQCFTLNSNLKFLNSLKFLIAFYLIIFKSTEIALVTKELNKWWPVN